MASPEPESAGGENWKDPLVGKHEKHENKQNKNNPVEIDEALTKSGFNITHILIISTISLTAFSLFVQIELVNLLGAELYCTFDLTPVEEALLTSALFTGMAVGAQMWGPVSDKQGRKRVVQICSLFSALFVLASSFGQSFIQIYIIRLLIGLAMGGFHVTYTYATEIVGPGYRTKSCMIIFLFHFLAGIYAGVTGMLLVPNSEHGWRFFVLFSALPIVIGLILISILCPESPRFLLISGKRNEATVVIQKLNPTAGENLELSPLTITERGSWRDLTRTLDDKILLGLLSLAIFLIRFFNLGGPLLFYETLQNPHASKSDSLFVETYKPSKKCERLKSEDYARATLFTVSQLIGALIYYFSADRLGRILTMFYTMAWSTLVLITFYFVMPDWFRTSTAMIDKSLCIATELTFSLYINEIYPTFTRSSASGLTDSFSRIGLAISPLFAQYLAKESYVASVTVYVVTGGFICGLLRFVRSNVAAENELTSLNGKGKLEVK